MSAVLSADIVAAFRECCARFEPELLSGADCAALAEELARAEKACSAARLIASARAVGCGAHRERGFSDGAAWMARQVGGTTGQSRQALGTAAGLAGCPGTRSALLAGELSVLQAAEVVRSEAEAPGGEARLLEVARSSDLGQLRDKAREHRQANCDVADLHRQQMRARHLRHWRDRLGMVCFEGSLPPHSGVPFVKRLELAAQRARRGVFRSGGERERFEAYAADALVEITGGQGPGRSPRAELVIVCDLFAWRRGHTHPGEVCQVIGGGPVPVEVARELGKDAFLKAVLHDGVAIHTLKHLGRHLPAELRSALDLGPVPGFSGAQCTDCGSRFGLEYDHVNPVANKGETSYDNLEPRCWADHRAKTERDRRAGLLGPDLAHLAHLPGPSRPASPARPARSKGPP